MDIQRVIQQKTHLKDVEMDRADFEAELEELVIKATNEGINLKGDFPVQHPAVTKPNYDVLITEFK